VIANSTCPILTITDVVFVTSIGIGFPPPAGSLLNHQQVRQSWSETGIGSMPVPGRKSEVQDYAESRLLNASEVP